MEDQYQKQLERYLLVKEEAKHFISNNFDEVAKELHYFEQDRTSPLGKTLQSVVDILTEIEPIYQLSDVSALLAEIKLDRAFDK